MIEVPELIQGLQCFVLFAYRIFLQHFLLFKPFPYPFML
jgi:hypothetical protein